MSISQLLTEDRRLVILRALAEDPGYSHNESVLQSILAAFGHVISRDQVKSLISWLAEQDLVSIDYVGDYMVAKLRPRGADAASGAAIIPGVKRPGPRD